MTSYLPYVDKLPFKRSDLIDELKAWVNINSGSENLAGLEIMQETLIQSFKKLNTPISVIPLKPYAKTNPRGELIYLPTGNALHLKKHNEAPFKVFLAGHMDTVYPSSSPFQKAEQLENNILRGPGVADMKGGLLILLKALDLLESSPMAGKIGWEVLINPDEEIGSPSSHYLFTEKAKQFDVGLIFEPSYPDGSLVSERKGTINYTFIAKGKAAHAGRDFYAGRNAIVAMAKLVQSLEQLTDKQKGITLNVGYFEGGTTVNIVPDLCICKVNVRVQNIKDLQNISQVIKSILKQYTHLDGIEFELHEHTSRPPKLFNKKAQNLFNSLRHCGEKLNLNIQWQPSGGVCDGNLLAAAGLPTIDTLGVVGGHMHTHDEYILIDSLIERIRLTALFLMQLTEREYQLEILHG